MIFPSPLDENLNSDTNCWEITKKKSTNAEAYSHKKKKTVQKIQKQDSQICYSTSNLYQTKFQTLIKLQFLRRKLQTFQTATFERKNCKSSLNYNF